MTKSSTFLVLDCENYLNTGKAAGNILFSSPMKAAHEILMSYQKREEKNQKS